MSRCEYRSVVEPLLGRRSPERTSFVSVSTFNYEELGTKKRVEAPGGRADPSHLGLPIS